ncbi:MAG: hypothetical protein NWR65_08690, partial [Saprospiraceae bacterium]|nr:hypothetical protein [Saprospiraceae bacterium]
SMTERMSGSAPRNPTIKDMLEQVVGEVVGNGLYWPEVAGEFEKLVQRGYCTAHLVFEGSQGYLVGEANRGLNYMFQMMNDARIAVGRGGAAIASAAYYASLQYAQERQQGRRLLSGGRKDEAAGPTLIINHPDVRRMLFLQKAIYE